MEDPRSFKPEYVVRLLLYCMFCDAMKEFSEKCWRFIVIPSHVTRGN